MKIVRVAPSPSSKIKIWQNAGLASCGSLPGFEQPRESKTGTGPVVCSRSDRTCEYYANYWLRGAVVALLRGWGVI